MLLMAGGPTPLCPLVDVAMRLVPMVVDMVSGQLHQCRQDLHVRAHVDDHSLAGGAQVARLVEDQGDLAGLEKHALLGAQLDRLGVEQNGAVGVPHDGARGLQRAHDRRSAHGLADDCHLARAQALLGELGLDTVAEHRVETIALERPDAKAILGPQLDHTAVQTRRQRSLRGRHHFEARFSSALGGAGDLHPYFSSSLSSEALEFSNFPSIFTSLSVIVTVTPPPFRVTLLFPSKTTKPPSSFASPEMS